MITIYSKQNCPFCEKAKGLCELKRLEYTVVDLTKDPHKILDYVPNARTFPQIFEGDKLIGGYDQFNAEIDKIVFRAETETMFDSPDSTMLTSSGDKLVSMSGNPNVDMSGLDSKKTVFNVNNKGYESGQYPLFLGESLGFTDTINQPYPILDTLYQRQVGQLWNELEVDLTQDRQDMINADPKVVDLMVKTIMYQMLADSIASRSITGVLLDYVTNSDLEALYNVIAFFESIHARTYSHIVKQTFVDPNKALQEGYANTQVIKRGDSFKTAFDNLINVEYGSEETEELLYVALVALYILESLNFMASFAITFGVAETGIFQGTSQLVKLICRDEMLHGLAGAEVLKIEFKNKPHLLAKLRPLFQTMLDDAIKAEDDWTDYLFSEGRACVGITAPLIKEQVRYLARPVAETLGLELTAPDTAPLSFMQDYIDSSKVQVAAQELQLTSYLVNSTLPVACETTMLNNIKEELTNASYLR